MSNFKYPTLYSLLGAIAEAIRDGERTANLINAQDLPDRIAALSGSAYEFLLDGSQGAVKSSNVSTLRNYALCGQTLTEVDLPSVFSLGYMAFADTGFMGSYDLVLPSVSDTGSYPFQRCGARSITLPAILAFGENAFEDSTSLELIHIGSQCTNLNWGCFKGCSNSNLRIVIEASYPPQAQSNTFSGIASTARIYVPDDAVEVYKTCTNWTVVADKILPMSELPA